MKLSNLNIGTRLTLGFAAILALLVVLAGISIWRLQTVGAMVDRMVQNDFQHERRLNRWVTIIEVNTARTYAAAKATEPDTEKFFLDGIASLSTEAVALQKQIEADLADATEKSLFAEVMEKRKTYQTARTAAFKEKSAGNMDAAKKFFTEDMQPKIDAYMVSIQKLYAYQKSVIDAASAAVDQQYKTGRTLVIILTCAAVLVGLAFGFWISRSITNPINEALRVAQVVAAGDLTSVFEIDSNDETGRLLQALKEMNERLAKIVGDVRNGTDTIASASSEIASGNLDLSSRTEEQASSLEETASSMEQLTGTVKQNADNARQANVLAASASEVAIKGGAVVAQVVETMESINASSKKIVDIIAVIDGIAFQTNILALNAAVEAARAGEQGRGFAVVASEVRSLAQRSAQAAKEIKTLIGDSVDKVGAGSKLVDEAGATMNEIVASVKRVTDIMGEIASASNEQTAGIEQINQAITQMDDATQQNSALVEQAAAAAASMQDQAAQLAQTVRIFKIDEQAYARPALRKPAPAMQRTATRAVAAAKPVPAAKKAAAATAGGDDWEEF